MAADGFPGRQFGTLKGGKPPNAGREFPAEVLTTAEVTEIVGQCSAASRTGIRNRALIMVLFRSGMRVSEALSIKPSAVNLKEHSIRVLHTKSGRAQTRGFHPSVTDALARWIDARKTLGLRNGPLFCTLDGGELSHQYVSNLLKRLAGQCGIEKRVSPHGLRHAYAAELERAGMRLGLISKLLGHSSVAVTDRYLQSLTNAEAIEALEDLDLPPLETDRPARAARAVNRPKAVASPAAQRPGPSGSVPSELEVAHDHRAQAWDSDAGCFPCGCDGS